jgi:hypothetical protein
MKVIEPRSPATHSTSLISDSRFYKIADRLTICQWELDGSILLILSIIVVNY